MQQLVRQDQALLLWVLRPEVVTDAKVSGWLLCVCVNVCPGIDIGGGLNDGYFPLVNAEQHLRVGDPSPQCHELVLRLSHLPSCSGGAGVESHHSFLADRQ